VLTATSTASLCFALVAAVTWASLLLLCSICVLQGSTSSPSVCRLAAPLQATPTDFVITGSADGHLKFWKKQEQGIEFVKHYRSHIGAVDGEERCAPVTFATSVAFGGWSGESWHLATAYAVPYTFLVFPRSSARRHGACVLFDCQGRARCHCLQV
jgi:hypothetical protein